MKKLLTATNRVRYIRINTKPILNYSFHFSKNSILSRINQDPKIFSPIYEMRITFSSSSRDMVYDYYLKHPRPMSEIRLNQTLAQNRRLINCLNRYSSHPLIRNYTHRRVIYVNDISKKYVFYIFMLNNLQ